VDLIKNFYLINFILSKKKVELKKKLIISLFLKGNANPMAPFEDVNLDALLAIMVHKKTETLELTTAFLRNNLIKKRG
jgi:hypothetical protein